MSGHASQDRIELPGLDGANPLGFLAALGTLVTLHDAGERSVRLSWIRTRTWTPALHGASAMDPAGLSEIIAGGLKGRDVAPEADEARARAVQVFEAAKKALKDKRNEIKTRRLKGADRRAAIEAEFVPVEQDYEAARRAWLGALSAAVPRAELALGKRVDCSPEEYRQHADAMMMDSTPDQRDAVDLLAAFGTDACVTKNKQIEPTPFQFIAGSGHQFFLKTARELMENVTADRVRRTLFEPWIYADEGLSMRWDPLEDRRYALMDRDPTASGNKPRTVWMANLLAYRAVSLFPAVPRRGALRVVGWSEQDGDPAFTWPLWEHPVLLDTVRSLVALPELRQANANRADLRARGVAAAYRTRRIKVGTGANHKLNFTPARAV